MPQTWAMATIGDSRGLHARLAWQVRQAVLASGCHVLFTWQGRTAEADSFTELLALGVSLGDTIRVAVDGLEAASVSASLCSLLERSEQALALTPTTEGILAPGRADGVIYRVNPDVDALQSRLHNASLRDRAAQALQAELASQPWDEDISAILEASLAVLTCADTEQAELLRSVPGEVLRDVLRRLQQQGANLAEQRDIVVAGDYLLPADLLSFPGHRVVAACVMKNGWLSHAAVYARALGIPMIRLVPGELAALPEGQMVTIDALASGERLLRPWISTEQSLVRFWLDATSPEQVYAGLAEGALGVGLVRSELLAAEAGGWQAERLSQAISDLLEAAGRRTLILRLPQADGLHVADADDWLWQHPLILQTLLGLLADLSRGHDVRLAVPRVSSQENWQAIADMVHDMDLSLYACIESNQGLVILPSLVPRPDGLLLGTGDLAADLAGLNREVSPTRDVFYSIDFVQAVRMLVLRAQELALPLIGCGAAVQQLPEATLLVSLGLADLAVPLMDLLALGRGLAHFDAQGVSDLGRELLKSASEQQIQMRVQGWLEDTGAWL